jgi:hypothetical protein
MNTNTLPWLMAVFATVAATGLVVWAGMVMQQMNDDLSEFAGRQV